MGSLLCWVHLSVLCSFDPIRSWGHILQRFIWSHGKKKNIIFFFEHSEASPPDSKLSLIAYSSDSKLSIMRMIDVRCSGLISSNTPSVIQYANRKCLSDMRVLSIVLIVRLSFSYAKINNNYYNPLDHNELNRTKKMKNRRMS